MGNRTFLVAQTLAESLNGIVNLVVLLGGVHARKTRAASASTVGLRTRARSTALATGLLPALLVPRLPAGLPLVLGNAGVVVVVGLGLVGAVLGVRSRAAAPPCRSGLGRGSARRGGRGGRLRWSSPGCGVCHIHRSGSRGRDGGERGRRDADNCRESKLRGGLVSMDEP